MRKPKAKPNLDCALCNGPWSAAAAEMRELDASDEEVAAACGCNVETVQKHFAACVMIPENDDSSTLLSDAALQKLITDANDTYTLAQRVGNLVASSAALSVRLRGLCEQHRRAEARAEEQAAVAVSGIMTIPAMDALIREAELARPAREQAEAAQLAKSQQKLSAALAARREGVQT